MIHRRQRMIWTSMILVVVAGAAGIITLHFTGKNQQTSNTTMAMVSRPAKQLSTLSDVRGPFTPLGISFSDVHDGVMYGLTQTGDEVAAVTHDGGKSWTQTFALHGVLTGIWASPNSQVWMTGYRSDQTPILYHSADGGATWVPMNSGMFLGQIEFRDSTRGWAESGSSAGNFMDGSVTHLVTTADGGKTWTPIALPQNDVPISGYAFTNANDGWIMLAHNRDGNEAKTLYVTHDGGKSWTSILQTSLTAMGSTLSSGETMVGSLSPLSPNHIVVWAITIDGGRLFSIDSSGNWAVLGPASKGVLKGPVDMISPGIGYEIVARPAAPASSLLQTTDGGQHWQTVTSWSMVQNGSSPLGEWFGR